MYNLNLQSISILWHINQFVLKIVDNQFRVDLSELVNQLNHINFKFWQIYDSDYQYPMTINAFAGSIFLASENKYPSEMSWNTHNTVMFINELKLYYPSIHKNRLQQLKQENRNRNNLFNYLDKLTQHYARLLFVRVDLSYREDSRINISLESFDEHLDKLLQHVSNKKTCFQHLQGFAWAIEQGSDKGIHVHLLLIYDGQKHQNDYGMGLQVGEKWVEITDNHGSYYNCNNNEYKANYIKKDIGVNNLGIGMIHRNNPQEVKNAINTGLYLTKPEKTDQYCCIKLPKARTFGHGQYNVSWRRGIIK